MAEVTAADRAMADQLVTGVMEGLENRSWYDLIERIAAALATVRAEREDYIRAVELELHRLRQAVGWQNDEVVALNAVERDALQARVTALEADLAHLHGQPFSRRDYGAMAARLDAAEARVAALEAENREIHDALLAGLPGPPRRHI